MNERKLTAREEQLQNAAIAETVYKLAGSRDERTCEAWIKGEVEQAHARKLQVANLVGVAPQLQRRGALANLIAQGHGPELERTGVLAAAELSADEAQERGRAIRRMTLAEFRASTSDAEPDDADEPDLTDDGEASVPSEDLQQELGVYGLSMTDYQAWKAYQRGSNGS